MTPSSGFATFASWGVLLVVVAASIAAEVLLHLIGQLIFQAVGYISAWCYEKVGQKRLEPDLPGRDSA